MNKVKEMQAGDVKKVAPLFKQYHQFYHVDSVIDDLEQYLHDRVTNKESVVYFVEDEKGTVLGFTQLYPLFCSLEMKKIWLLYDLYTTEAAREKGVGTLLLDKADELAKSTGSAFIMLSTAKDNHTAQRLYEKHDYVRDDVFYVYNKMMKN